jgi:c-di-GMP phosphodiesterase
MQAYHFFSPLLAPDQAWAAFDWQTFTASDPVELPALTALGDICAPLARQLPLWIPCQRDWLDNAAFREFIKKLGPNQVIPAFPSETAESRPHLAACQALRADDIHVALRVDDGNMLKQLAAGSFDHLLLDAEFARGKVPLIDLINAHQFGFHLVASGVRSHELFEWAVAKRFSLLSSQFVITVDSRAPVDADTTRLKLLKLLSLVVQDADTREIEEIFRQEPKLSYNLLRLVNSVAVGPRTPITGFAQAITVLGRRQLQRWLQLLIYANQFGQANQPNPLMQQAAVRGKLLEGMAHKLGPVSDIDDVGEAAYMVGIFSLLDTLLRLPMADILAALPLAEPLAAALGRQEGPLGRLLHAVVEGERGNHAVAGEALVTLGIDAVTHVRAQADALLWASRITLE